MGDWPLLSDAQRMEGVGRLGAWHSNRCLAPVRINTDSCVRTCCAWRQRSARQGLMVIRGFCRRGTSVVPNLAHFKAILSAAPELPA